MMYKADKIEFDLTIRIKGEEETQEQIYDRYPGMPEKQPKIIVKEELKFNSLDPVSVIRKILDYIKQ